MTTTPRPYQASTFLDISIATFLNTVVRPNLPDHAATPYFCLCTFSTTNGWKEHWFNWPTDLHKIIDLAIISAGQGSDVYFSSYVFTAPNSQKQYAIQSHTIQADLDQVEIDTIPIEPTILVETSTKRYQAYWVLADAPSLDTLEENSRKLTYSIENCDRSGWPIGRKVRLPGTFNYKYEEAQLVEIISRSSSLYTIADFELLPEPELKSLNTPDIDIEFIDNPPHLDVGPQELFHSLRQNIPPKVVPNFNTKSNDRSASLWALMCALFRADVPREQVFHIAKYSANNKFDDLHFHADRELAKDVLRAETATKFRHPDPRQEILEVRRNKKLASERKAIIQDIVLDNLKQQGTFYHSRDDTLWYVRRDLGRPINVSPQGDWLKMLLDRQFGLNPTETEAAYVGYGLQSYVKEQQYNAERQSLSFFDADQNTLLLHTGAKDVIKITPNSVQRVPNGYGGILFPWPVSTEPFIPSPPTTVNGTIKPWGDELFGKSINNIQHLTPEEAKVILEVWFLFLLFKSTSISRPILAIFGQPGAGKSTIFRMVYALLYGRHRSLAGVTTPDDFDYAVSYDPLLVLDNVDTWERWLPDRLAQSAATSDLPKRKLYTDTDVIKVRRQALVGITAHNPKFGREDVADRLLLLTLERLTHFAPEGEMIANIVRKRNQLWGQIVQDIQTILSTKVPPLADQPQFRVEDFARIGYWIAFSLNKHTTFTKALQAIVKDQKSFVLEEDSVLVAAITTYCRRSESANEYKNAGRLWIDLEGYAPDPLTFNRLYKNAITLGKKIWTLQPALKEMIDVEASLDPITGQRLWRISEKPHE